jgi:tRNA A37 methylthiotransferase MiaB
MKLLIIENPRPLTIEHYNDVANAPLSASLNSGYALAVARRAGWETAYLDLTASRENETIMADRILAENADIILFHWVYSWGNEDVVRTILTILRNSHGGSIGAFGLFPTLAYQRLTHYAPQLDFILVGEFEATLEELIATYQNNRFIPSLPGLYCSNIGFVRRDLIAELSQLPVPDDVGTNCQYPTLNISASRGCFGDCSFCFINPFYGCSRRRERSIASFRHELETRLIRRPVNSLYFIDPTFVGYDEKLTGRAVAISSILKDCNLPFGFETRVDTIDEKLINRLASNGASSVFLGIESGCETTLQRINKRITRQQIISAVRAVQNSGIYLSVGFIMFEPDSTLDELSANYALLDELGLLSHHDQTINMLYHSQIVLYGSKAWDKFDAEGRLLVHDEMPFEACYQFKHENVARVCNAMRRLSSEYFTRIDRLYQQQGIARSEQFACCHDQDPPGINGYDLNQILKNAFLAFIKHSNECGLKQFKAMEQIFINELKSCF